MRLHLTRILIVLVTLSGVVVVGRSFRDNRPFNRISFAPWQTAGQDRFSKMARRYEPLLPHLRGLKTVGWVSSFGHEKGHRMMAQSMLAPTLVIDSDTPETMIASFEDDVLLDAFLGDGRFDARQRLGNGVAILQRRPR